MSEKCERETHPIEVSLEEMHFLSVFEEAGPKVLVEVFLLQHHLHGTGRVVHLAGLGIDLGIQVQCHLIIGFLGLAESLERQLRGLHVHLDLLGVHIWHGDAQENVILFRFRFA